MDCDSDEKEEQTECEKKPKAGDDIGQDKTPPSSKLVQQDGGGRKSKPALRLTRTCLRKVARNPCKIDIMDKMFILRQNDTIKIKMVDPTKMFPEDSEAVPSRCLHVQQESYVYPLLGRPNPDDSHCMHCPCMYEN